MPKKKAAVRRAGGVVDISKQDKVFIDGPLATDFLVLTGPFWTKPRHRLGFGSTPTRVEYTLQGSLFTYPVA